MRDDNVRVGKRLTGWGFKARGCAFLLGVLVFAPGIVTAVDDDPNAPAGVMYSKYGLTEGLSGACPFWEVALSRFSTDGPEDRERQTPGPLVVEVDACVVADYEVFTVEQRTRLSEIGDIDLFPGDFFVVWDEDDGHGSNQSFTFTGRDANSVELEPDYVRVFNADNPNNTLNWVVYTVTGTGTLRVTNTDLNEHDAFRLTVN